MNYIGVDLHKKIITVCVMDQNRTVLARKTLYCNQPDQIVEFFRKFQPFKVVVEATANYHWLVDRLEPLAEKVVLANPKKLRVIAESTEADRLDAQILAEFLARDMIPEAYMPTPRQRPCLRTSFFAPAARRGHRGTTVTVIAAPGKEPVPPWPYGNFGPFRCSLHCVRIDKEQDGRAPSSALHQWTLCAMIGLLGQ